MKTILISFYSSSVENYFSPVWYNLFIKTHSKFFHYIIPVPHHMCGMTIIERYMVSFFFEFERFIWLTRNKFMKEETIFTDKHIPEYFKPILWSYDIRHMDSIKEKRTVIVHAINYGDIKHWRWLIQCYGKDMVREVLEIIPVTSLRPRVRKLAALVFDVKKFNYAPRSAS